MSRLTSAPAQKTSGETLPASVKTTLQEVERLLAAGKNKQALEILQRDRTESLWLRNAVGVCRLRQGDAAAAMETFRGMVLAPGGFDLRDDAPLTFKINYAAALLLMGNLHGCERVLHDLRDHQHPSLQRLHDAIAGWKSRLTFWQKLNLWFGGEPASKVELDYPPGDLN